MNNQTYAIAVDIPNKGRHLAGWIPGFGSALIGPNDGQYHHVHLFTNKNEATDFLINYKKTNSSAYVWSNSN